MDDPQRGFPWPLWVLAPSSPPSKIAELAGVIAVGMHHSQGTVSSVVPMFANLELAERGKLRNPATMELMQPYTTKTPAEFADLMEAAKANGHDLAAIQGIQGAKTIPIDQLIQTLRNLPS